MNLIPPRRFVGTASSSTGKSRGQQRPWNGGTAVLNKKLLRILVLALVLTMLAAACGGDEDEGTQTTATTEAGGISEIRFVFSPDPAWDWIKDQGILEEMEAASDGYRIVQNTTWDEIGLFAGGHADIVSIASYETPMPPAWGSRLKSAYRCSTTGSSKRLSS